MSIVIETCPKCGHDLLNEVLTSYPPIHKKRCIACGWSWVGKREEIIRVPFNEESIKTTQLVQHANISSSNEDNCIMYLNNLNNTNGETTKIRDIDILHIISDAPDN